jgi:hypothetical protein
MERGAGQGVGMACGPCECPRASEVVRDDVRAGDAELVEQRRRVSGVAVHRVAEVLRRVGAAVASQGRTAGIRRTFVKRGQGHPEPGTSLAGRVMRTGTGRVGVLVAWRVGVALLRPVALPR